MIRLLPRALDCAGCGLLVALFWVDSILPRRRAPPSPPPPADACVFCWESLGTGSGCLMCEAKRHQDASRAGE